MEPRPLVERAHGLLAEVSPYEGDRLLHVEAVATTTRKLGRALGDVEGFETVCAAAWLHDIGYAPAIRGTAHHAIDGAVFLRARGWPASVTSLVAHHSGAIEEAKQRGLLPRLRDFPTPPAELADVLTLADMTCGPAGQPMSVDERLQEILGRYPGGHPVHRAVSGSAYELRVVAARVQRRLGLVDA